MIKMSDMHDVGMMYGKEAADTYDKLYELGLLTVSKKDTW